MSTNKREVDQEVLVKTAAQIRKLTADNKLLKETIETIKKEANNKDGELKKANQKIAEYEKEKMCVKLASDMVEDGVIRPADESLWVNKLVKEDEPEKIAEHVRTLKIDVEDVEIEKKSNNDEGETADEVFLNRITG